MLITAHRRGFVMANTGIDQSNIEHPDGNERVLLLPENPDGAAADLKTALDAAFGVACVLLRIAMFPLRLRRGRRLSRAARLKFVRISS